MEAAFHGWFHLRGLMTEADCYASRTVFEATCREYAMRAMLTEEIEALDRACNGDWPEMRPAERAFNAGYRDEWNGGAEPRFFPARWRDDYKRGAADCRDVMGGGA